MQRLADASAVVEAAQLLQLRADRSGRATPWSGSTQGRLPEHLRVGIEHLSGMNLADVRVHENSTRPASVQALAYASGNEIHLGPGQHRHLAHEAWHIVQQRQGRVPATARIAGVEVNDDAGLEHEADSMGAQALRVGAGHAPSRAPLSGAGATRAPIQRQGDGSREIDINDLPEDSAREYMKRCFQTGGYVPPKLDAKGAVVQRTPTRSAYDGGELFVVAKTDLDKGTPTTSGTRAYVNDAKTFKPTFVQFNYLFAARKPASISNTWVYQVENPKPSSSYASGRLYDAGHKLARQNGGLGGDNDWVFPQHPGFNQGNSRLMNPTETLTTDPTFPMWREHEQHFHDEVSKEGYGAWWIQLS